jgi:hypothetical protein
MKCIIVLSALIAIGLCAPAPQFGFGFEPRGGRGYGRRGLRQFDRFGFGGPGSFSPYYDPFYYQDPYYGGDYYLFKKNLKNKNPCRDLLIIICSYNNWHFHKIIIE